MKRFAFLLPFLLIAACTDDTIIQNQSTVRSITVSGQADVAASPDLAVLTFSVRSRGQNAGAAFSEASRTMNQVISTLKEEGIAERDLQTESIALNPVYGQNDRGFQDRQRIVGYEGYQSLTVRLRQIGSAGQVIDAAVEAGANELQSFQLTFDDPAELEARARLAAVENARAKAEAMAEAAGADLGEVLQISEGGGGQPMPYAARGLAMDQVAAEATKIEAGERNVGAQVSVTFALD